MASVGRDTQWHPWEGILQEAMGITNVKMALCAAINTTVEQVTTQAFKVVVWHQSSLHHQDWLEIYTRHKILCFCGFAYKFR